MAVPSEFSSGDTLSLVTTVAWAIILAFGLYRYRKGKQSREQLYALATVALVWLSFGVLQFDYLVSGWVEVGIEVFSILLLITGIVVGIRWVRMWGSESDEGTDSAR